jgi:NADH:ubiquinone oxidoreductase subunit B-like Fe-S oxidoreductase
MKNIADNDKPTKPIKKKMFSTLLDKLEKWSETNFFIPTFITGTSTVNELICFLNSDVAGQECLISSKESSNLRPDILFICGSINYKKLEIIKEHYNNLEGNKFVVTIGGMTKNIMEYNTYNSPGKLNDFIPVDLHIYGNPPSKLDILNGLRRLKDLRNESN